KITREQAFFYYTVMLHCSNDEYEMQSDHVHTPNRVRDNAGYSLMPEFTRAFGCKAGDAMYAEEESSCYLFGPQS
ncbi:hypothetical protein PFISCL1PPCAC_12675, partial [Pristionchus fissidentatus]